MAQDNRTLKGKPKTKQVVSVDEIPLFRPDAQTLYGEEALWVEKDPNYIFRKVRFWLFSAIDVWFFQRAPRIINRREFIGRVQTDSKRFVKHHFAHVNIVVKDSF